MLVEGDRRYRVRGLRKNLSYGSLRLNVFVSRDGDLFDSTSPLAGFFVDTFDLYAARAPLGLRAPGVSRAGSRGARHQARPGRGAAARRRAAAGSDREGARAEGPPRPHERRGHRGGDAASARPEPPRPHPPRLLPLRRRGRGDEQARRVPGGHVTKARSAARRDPPVARPRGSRR